MQQDGLEAALAATGEQLAQASRAAALVSRELKRASQAAAAGATRDLRKALAAVEAATRELEARDSSFDFDETAYLAGGGYAKELLAQAQEQGVAMFEEDERLLCYPSLVRLVPGDAAIEVDRKRDKRLRPSVVVAALKARQDRPLRVKAEPFLESLLGAYELLAVGRADPVVRLDAVWGVLTLLPGQARDYSRPEFARDLYLLDQSGVTTSKAGRALRWHASTGTKGAGVLTTVARSGQQQRYWGVSFTSA